MNFKQLGAAIVIAAGAYGYSEYIEGTKRTDVASEFGLDKAQTTVMRECKTSLSRHSRQFREGIDPVRGCACVAQHLTKGIRPDQYAAASDVVDLMIERSKESSPGSITRQFRSKPRLAQLDTAETLKLIMVANSSVTACGRQANLAPHTVANVDLPATIAPLN